MIYFDNASTTAVKKEVAEAVYQSMQENFGNPSSTYSIGRKSKVLIENTRNRIAKSLNCLPKEIIFTSGGTESDNAVIENAVKNIGVERIVSSKLEHDAVLESIEHFAKDIEAIWLENDNHGVLDLEKLDSILSDGKLTLVSLMHVNNEIGNINPIDEIAQICKTHNAIFHSDTVQSFSLLNIDLQKTSVDFICASAHKFGGPKGIGFLFKRDGVKFSKLIFGGEQERNFRAGTENLHSIVGLDKAVEIAFNNKEAKFNKLIELKKYLISKLNPEEITTNGLSGDLEKSSPSILNLHLKKVKESKMLVFNFDIKGIAISEGSACSSGRNLGSHVLRELGDGYGLGKNIRVSFNEGNTFEEIDSFIQVLEEYVDKMR